MLYFLKLLEKEEKNLPRQPRKRSYSHVYHCMLRGVNKQDIFFEEKDYLKFQEMIKKTQEKYLYSLYAYVLMPNHIHLEIKDENEKLSQIIHCMATGYANYFNKKYQRVGHVFENRFVSKNVESSKYLLNLVRYIHQNPLKAGISPMENYKWSSYLEYFSDKKKIVESQEVLSIFLEEKRKGSFLEFNQKILKFKSSTEFLEYEMKNRMTDEEVIYFIKKKLGLRNIQEIQNYNVEHRNALIGIIGKMEGTTRKQIARVTGIALSVIDKALYKKEK